MSLMNDDEKRHLVHFIYESDAIEGITDDRKLLEKVIAVRKRDGHVGAMLLLRWLASTDYDLVGKELVCLVQGFITAEQHEKPGGKKLPEDWVGKYRKIDVSVGGRKCPDPASIPQAMDKLFEEIRCWQKNAKAQGLEHNIQRVADFHFRFEKKHPFADGNGRTGRALVWYLFKCAGIRPFIFTNCDKHETYYGCFEEREAMRKYFLGKMGFGIQTLPIQ